MKLTTVRTIVVVAVFVAVGVSLATHAASGTLSAFGYDSIALLCPVGALEVMLGVGSVIPHVLVLLAVVLVAVLVFGKAFCSWLCPTPLLQSLIRRPGGRRDAPGDDAVVDEPLAADDEPAGACKAGCAGGCASCGALPPVGGRRDGFHLDTRFAVLGGTLASAALFGFPVFCLICPVGLTFATFIGLWHLVQFNETSWGLLLFPAILVVELVVARKWCHRFCPISALLSLISTGNRLLVPHVDEKRCLRERGIDCRACVTACPEELDPHADRLPECSKCGRCREACPAGAISIRLLPARRSRDAADQPAS
ncbi:MAG: 4Fe-4S binding protein [Eggerthellaceae bacterium]|nr:4Fe-4S binding protein [Eggerthellaceae bacterium]